MPPAAMRLSSLTCCLSLLLLASPLIGQNDEVRIVGRVIADDSDAPLGYATVSLMRHTGRLLQRIQTDEKGNFEFTTTYIPAVKLSAKLLGYQAATTPILHLDGRRFFQVEIRLDSEAILLAPLEVIAWSEVDRSPFLDNFRRRVASGMGTYITRAQIEERRPVFISDMLREVPGVEVSSAGSGSRPRVSASRSSAAGCVTQLFVDGFLVNRRGPGGVDDVRIDDLVSPGSVEGIEIYRGLSTVPPEFLNADAACGVIAIWTRRGGIRP